MAWSSGQRRSLPLQGSRVRISALPSFFAVVTAMMLRWQPKRFNYGSGTPQARRVGPEQRRERQNKMDSSAGKSGTEHAERRWFALKAIKWLTPSME